MRKWAGMEEWIKVLLKLSCRCGARGWCPRIFRTNDEVGRVFEADLEEERARPTIEASAPFGLDEAGDVIHQERVHAQVFVMASIDVQLAVR